MSSPNLDAGPRSASTYRSTTGSKRPARILLVDDHEPLLRALGEYLREHDYEVACAATGGEALEVLEREEVDLAFLDMVLPDMSGMDLLSKATARYEVPVVMMTGYAEVGTCLEAIRRGAYEFVTKPLAPEILPVMIENALDHQRLVREERSRRDEPLCSLGALVGRSRPMLEVFQAIRDVASTDLPVLLTGETGTGKSLVARELHLHSPRVQGPYLHLNCTALQPTLFEAELFGYEKGAFTGAAETRLGRFERAQGGTLFLDEVSGLPLELQAKLLRVLEEREFERVGGHDTLRSEVRIVAATNVDLAEEIRAGRFRQDLYYRLCAFPIHLPPLRERTEDIPLLVARVLQSLAIEVGYDLPGVAIEALDEARRHSWPGNVRELAHAVERALITCRDGVLESILPAQATQLEDYAAGAPSPRPLGGEGGVGSTDPPRRLGGLRQPAWLSEDAAPGLDELTRLSFKDASARFQAAYFSSLMRRHRGNKVEAAAEAGVDRRTLQRYLTRLDLEVEAEGEAQSSNP